MKRRGFLQAAGAAAFAVPAPAGAAPLVIHDALGRAVAIAAPPQRIVPIFASNTEIVASLGLADRIVGIEAYTRFPPEVLDRPLVGGRLGFSVDAVVALRPDLLVVTPSRQAANQLIDPMERLGIPIVVFLQRSVAEILSNIRLMATIAGVPERGAEVTGRLQARLDRIRQRLEGWPLPTATMITGRLGNGLMLVERPESYTANTMMLAGTRRAFANSGVIAQVSPEAILNIDPDVLLFAGSERDLRELIARPGFADMRAVREKRTHIVSRAQFRIPGPRTFDGIEALARVLHPAAFG
ncbi:MAG: ABC transporter substrate-binding protein [Acidimicrobiia bacterium]